MQVKNAEDERVQALLRALGFCAKARALVYGTPMVCEALKGNKKPHLVVSALDNAPNTQKRIADRCAFYGVSLVSAHTTGADLAHALGKEGHLAVVAITDEQLCRLVRSKLSALEKNETEQ